MNLPTVVSRSEWESARAELLAKEKEATRARDALAAERRRMPMVAVERRTGSRARTARRACSTSSPGAASCSSTASSSSRGSRAGRRPAAAGARCSPTRSASSPTCTRATRRSCWCRRRRRRTSAASESGSAGRSPGSRRATTSRPTSTCRSTSASTLPARWRPDLPHLLHDRPGSRGARQRLDVPRPDPARAPGDVGGLARGPPAGPAVQLVAAARRVRRSGHLTRSGSSRRNPGRLRGATPTG